MDCVSAMGEPDAECCIQFCTQHCRSNFLPFSRFQADELKEAVEKMRRVVGEDTSDHFREDELDDSMERLDSHTEGIQTLGTYHERDPPRFCFEDLSSTGFIRHWSYGVPAVVNSVKFQGKWDPDYFINTYGEQKVTLEDCETGKTKPSTVAAFFRGFLDPSNRDRIWKLKVSCFSVSWTLCLTFRCGS